jgi:N-methylhydantoinase B
MTTPDYDVIAAEVHRKALDNLVAEMGITLMRTSGSPVVTEAKDFCTCLLDTKPEQLSLSPNIIFHVGSSLYGTKAIVDLVEDGDLRPGDGWIVNDPHSAGAMHQGDVSVIMPTFVDDELLGWSFANVHILDIGGVGVSAFAPGARDVYQEGLRFPPVRIIREGVLDREWETFIAANVRVPGPVLNDIRSLVAANNTAATKLRQVVGEFGVDNHRLYSEINKDLSEQVMRDRISKLADGVYETLDWNEFDGHDGPDQLLEMRLRLEVDGSELRFTYSGAPQIDAFVNSTMGPMFGNAMSSLMTLLLFGDVPLNSGLWRPITFDIGEPGTIVNSQPPAPVSNAHAEVGFRAGKMARELLCQAIALSDDPTIRSRVAAQNQDGFPSQTLAGINQHGGVSVLFYMDNVMGVGGAAQTIGDGLDCYGHTCTTGAGLPDIETNEGNDPVLYLWRRLVPNCGGPGITRGGLGLETGIVVHSTDALSGPAFNACSELPPRGAGGGYPASAGTYSPVRASNALDLLSQGIMPTRERLEGTPEHVRAHMTHLVHARGDVFVTTSGGGAGLGDPLLRDPEKVAADVIAGYVTAGHAEKAYGVVLDEDRRPDDQATERSRAEIRRARIGGEPAKAWQPPANLGVSLVRDEGSWRCSSCDEQLADAASNWRDGAVCSENPVAERFAELEMTVRDRSEEPRVMMREYFCPGCAASLGVDIGTSASETLPAPQALEAALAAIG